MSPDNFNLDSLSLHEWHCWKDLSHFMILIGAVTQEDANSRSSQLDTNGQQLYEKIRIWGNALAALRVAQSQQEK
jgi:hypothetical protein